MIMKVPIKRNRFFEPIICTGREYLYINTLWLAVKITILLNRKSKMKT
tara:strand:+ start:5933 stop:6076 length:144 start_codon:yes stop_codon:yes gene_type:complete